MKLLLLRKDSKSVILSVCREMLKPGQQADLSTIAKILDMLNKVYQQHLEKEVLILVGMIICMFTVYVLTCFNLKVIFNMLTFEIFGNVKKNYIYIYMMPRLCVQSGSVNSKIWLKPLYFLMYVIIPIKQLEPLPIKQ